MSWLEMAIIAFITVSIGFIVWRGGAANPVGTGSLGAKLNKQSREIVALTSRVGHVEAELAELKGEAATGKDIARIEERIETVRAEMAGHFEMSRQTNSAVRRLEQIILERGLK